MLEGNLRKDFASNKSVETHRTERWLLSTIAILVAKDDMTKLNTHTKIHTMLFDMSFVSRIFVIEIFSSWLKILFGC